MNDSREAVLKKFEGLRRREGATRRVDFKGLRFRLNLRVGMDLSKDLQIIKMATGEAKNSFCERVLKDAITRTLTEIRAQYDDSAWQAISDCAERRRK